MPVEPTAAHQDSPTLKAHRLPESPNRSRAQPALSRASRGPVPNGKPPRAFPPATTERPAHAGPKTQRDGFNGAPAAVGLVQYCHLPS
eukprot:2806447-Pyramimonas_sp.AAC.1